jgi:hypothetical protein
MYVMRVQEALGDSPVNDVAGVVGQLADPWARLHRHEYSGGVGRAVQGERVIVRGVRLQEQRKAIKKKKKPRADKIARLGSIGRRLKIVPKLQHEGGLAAAGTHPFVLPAH